MNIKIEEILRGKVFRIKENLRKINFIIKNSSITLKMIVTAANMARGNDYHNFGHQLGVAEYVIKIAMAERRSCTEIDSLVITALYHDAKHTGVAKVFDEIIALESMEQSLSDEDFKILGEAREKSLMMMRDLFIATIFNLRGKINGNSLAVIMQDADLAHLGQGVYYWLWASMGLIKEFSQQEGVSISPIDFIRIRQEKFVDFLSTMTTNGAIWLSPGANLIFRNPRQDVQKLIRLSDEAIMYAYEVRHDDITLKEFTKKVRAL